MASQARLRRRHWGVLLSFLIGVILPVAIVGWYLWERAADQYASTVAFSVRTEENNSALELLGGITSLSGSSSSDTDILYEYLQSQKLVADMDAAIDLRRIWSQPLAQDPWFAFDPEGSIEDLVSHWDRMVKIYYDDGAGLIEVRALAFTAGDAQLIAETLFDQSSAMINDLSAIAREDAIRYAREDLEEALDQLKTAREAVTRFRNLNQLVDPSVDLQTQAGLLGNLEGQLANALIEYDLLTLSTRPDDPRVTQAERKIEVIRDRIAAERRKLGLAGGDGSAGDDVYANLFGEYERLVVDREFAEASYTSARASYDASLAEARRQSRYLAAYVRPTLAESARYPEREVLLGMAALLILLVWGMLVLVVYALKDRR
ncbi:MAG: capsule biosynthesis protein [Flavobacteriaceae bacterium]|nr:capsule biosynthesis protein [Flavobacteriaceae bacterium]